MSTDSLYAAVLFFLSLFKVWMENLWLVQWKHWYYILSWARKTWFYIPPQVDATETLQLAAVVYPSHLTCGCSFREIFIKASVRDRNLILLTCTNFSVMTCPFSALHFPAYQLHAFQVVFLAHGANSLYPPFSKEWFQELSKDFVVKFPDSSCHFKFHYELAIITNLFFRKI